MLSPAVRRWLPVAWVVALTALLLGPALAPGYVLTYDLVVVPRLSLTPDVLGVGSALPRAVPSDAVLAVLDHPDYARLFGPGAPVRILSTDARVTSLRTEVTYLDDGFRLVRGAYGSLYILERLDPCPMVWSRDS